ncbi:MAG: YdcF family protein [Verrucomicrobia bacterium]|nr:YdcF family protein [Verrucomicrobiota bacterium]
MQQDKSKLRRLKLILTVGVAVVVILPLLSRWLLRVEQPVTQPMDAIVVLGGDPGDRAPHAAELYKKGVASLVIVAGDGGGLAHALKMAGVPSSAIIQEAGSRTTWENARNVAPILEERGIVKVVLVTSWWHTRRALACFQTVISAVSFRSSHEAFRQDDSLVTPSMWGTVWLEYLKTTHYIILGKIAWMNCFPGK